MPGATIGQTFTTSTGHVHRSGRQTWRRTTEVSLTAEIYSQAAAAFGVGDGLSNTVVLDQTFNDVDLVGRPLTIGNFVSSSSIGALVFSVDTNTYTPYIVIGDDALPDSQLPEAITGTAVSGSADELPTGQPDPDRLVPECHLEWSRDYLGNLQREPLLTALDTPPGKDGTAENLSVNPSGPPIITPFDLTTLNILPGLQSPGAAQLCRSERTKNSPVSRRRLTPRPWPRLRR